MVMKDPADGEELTAMWKVLVVLELQRDPEEKLHHVSVPRFLLVNGVIGLGHHLPLFRQKKSQQYIPEAKKARLRKNEWQVEQTFIREISLMCTYRLCLMA